MANLTKRINIEGMCRTYQLWPERVESGDVLNREGSLEGIKPSTWSPNDSSRVERSYLIEEGAEWRNIPHYNFNIMQAARADNEQVKDIVLEKVPEAEQKFELHEVETMSEDFYRELAGILAYLSVDRSEGYAERYWYRPWQKALSMNEELRDGTYLEHPGKGATPDHRENDRPETNSAAEADW